MSVAALTGRTMVIQMDKGASTFVTIPGQRTTTFTITSSSVDVTSKDDTSSVASYNGALVRKLLDQGGPVSFSIDAQGIFTDSSMFHTANTYAQNDQSVNCVITMPGTSSKGSDKYTGKFKVTSLQYTGEYANAQQYQLKLESSDIITQSL